MPGQHADRLPGGGRANLQKIRHPAPLLLLLSLVLLFLMITYYSGNKEHHKNCSRSVSGTGNAGGVATPTCAAFSRASRCYALHFLTCPLGLPPPPPRTLSNSAQSLQCTMSLGSAMFLSYGTQGMGCTHCGSCYSVGLRNMTARCGEAQSHRGAESQASRLRFPGKRWGCLAAAFSSGVLRLKQSCCSLETPHPGRIQGLTAAPGSSVWR